MTKERACANTPGLPRRSFLLAAPASAAALALPATAAPLTWEQQVQHHIDAIGALFRETAPQDALRTTLFINQHWRPTLGPARIHGGVILDGGGTAEWWRDHGWLR